MPGAALDRPTGIAEAPKTPDGASAVQNWIVALALFATANLLNIIILILERSS